MIGAANRDPVQFERPDAIDVARTRCNAEAAHAIGYCVAGTTLAAPSGEAYPGGGNPIGTSMVFSHLAVRDMLNR